MRRDGEAFDFYLAERLHKTVAEIRAMPADEYGGWADWFEVKNALGDLDRRTEIHRGA